MENITFNDVPQLVSQLCEKVEHLTNEIRELQQKSTPDATTKLLSVQEAAKFLNTTVTGIYGLKHRGKIKGHKTPGGRRLYFDRDELIATIKSEK